MFKQVYALEKIHGTSANIAYYPFVAATADTLEQPERLTYFSGGASHASFLALFNHDELLANFRAMACPHEIHVHGEAYGGKEQGMSNTYGKQLKFIVFDVRVGTYWLAVPQAEEVAKNIKQEFVHYVLVNTTIEELDAQRDAFSVQAQRNGMGDDKPREGIVIRPPIEVVKNCGSRVCCKHKAEKFSERATSQKVIDVDKLKVLQEANAVAEEWVTLNRMGNIVSHLKPEEVDVTNTKNIIGIMIEDVLREAEGEIIDSPDVRKAIGKKTAEILKTFIKKKVGLIE